MVVRARILRLLVVVALGLAAVACGPGGGGGSTGQPAASSPASAQPGGY